MTPDHTSASGTPETPDQRLIFEQRLAEIAARDSGAATADTSVPGPDHGTPEASAAAETATHVPDEVTADGHDMSAPQARALTHYGAEMSAEAAENVANPVAAEAAALHPETPAPVVEAIAVVAPAMMAGEIEAPAVGTASAHEAAPIEAEPASEAAPEAAPATETHPEATAPAEAPARGIVNPVAAEAAALHPETAAPVVEIAPAAPVAEAVASVTPAAETAETVVETPPALPEVHIHAAAELEAAPEAVASLPTSSETPLAEVEAAGAAEAAHHGEAHHEAENEVVALAGDASDDEAADAGEAPAPADMPDFAGDDLPAQTQYLIGLLRGANPGKQRKLISDLTRQYEANVGNARAAARQKFADGGADAEAFAFQQPEGQ